MRDLFYEYVADHPDLRVFFCRHARALFEEPPTPAPWDPALVEELRAYQERLGGPVEFTGQEAAVVTGQQPALFIGPLYTVYKAITAIRIAEKMETLHRVPCVPVFWTASDDHDFAEACVAHFLTKTHEPLAIEYRPTQPVEGMPLYRVPLETSLHAMIDQAAAAAPGSEFKADIAQFLHDSLDVSDSFADWSARCLKRIFHGTRLVVFSPHLSAARAAACPVMEQEIRSPLAGTNLVNETGARLAGLGFTPQIVKGSAECGFFLEMGGKRRKVLFQDARYRIPQEDLTCTVDEMLTFLQTAPERFSPNAALRCVVQQHLFPVAAYIAGPAEAAYWLQLRPLFDHFGLPMPVVYPRAQASLTTMKLKKLLDKLGFRLDDLMAVEPSELVEQALRRAARNPAYDVLASRRDSVEAPIKTLRDDLMVHDRTAGDMAERLVRETAESLDRIERALLRMDKVQAEAIEKQVARLCHTLAPWRKPQERVYTIFSFLFQHGWDLVPRLLKTLDVESFSMNEVEL